MRLTVCRARTAEATAEFVERLGIAFGLLYMLLPSPTRPILAPVVRRLLASPVSGSPLQRPSHWSVPDTRKRLSLGASMLVTKQYTSIPYDYEKKPIVHLLVADYNMGARVYTVYIIYIYIYREMDSAFA